MRMRRLVLAWGVAVASAVCSGAESEAAPARAETDEAIVTGRGWSLKPLSNGARAFSNRDYVWAEVPAGAGAWTYTQTAGGVPAEIAVEAKRDMVVRLAAVPSQGALDLSGWRPLQGLSVRYTDGGRTALQLFERPLKAGATLALPQGSWAGGLLVLGVRFDGALERLAFNNPGLEVDLGVGLWAWPLPMDADADGDLDLVVGCPDKPYNGAYVFENPAGRTSRLSRLLRGGKIPVFKAGRWLSTAPQNVQVSVVGGQPKVLSPGLAYPDFLQSGFSKPVKIPGVKANVHTNAVRANMWRYADYDGDGRQDLVVGVGDWKAYGWDNAYDARGVWTNGPLHGYVYVLRNGGTDAEPAYAEPFKVMAGGAPVDVFGWPSPNFADWDGDGDLDLLCGEFLDGFTYFQNAGSRTLPAYAAGVRLCQADGERLAMDLEMITPTAVDWDGDGDLDLICGDEDGRVAFIENTGRLDARRAPLFKEPRYFRQEAQDVKFGALVTPVGCDWDGDGDWDLICGNTAGYIGFVENLSGAGVEKPRWAEPRRLAAGGRTLRIMAGPNGSIQGPCEAKWGYTTQTVADWDGDGLPDIVANSILGRVHWYRNIGTRRSPKLAAAEPVEVEWAGEQPALAWGWMRPEGKALLTQWRTTPVAVDWNRDGLTDLVMLDQEGYLAFFERAERGGRRVLLAPRRVFCDETGAALQFNAKAGGKSGRRKLCVADWDGDGALDILINSKNAELWRQVEAKDGQYRFKNLGGLHPMNIEGHDVSPTVVDFNADGVPDFIGGAEDGHLYYLRNPRTSTAQAR
jgi:hypothetical protein